MTFHLRQRLKHFFRDSESGSFSIEAVLMFPLLVWAFVAMYVYFEALREQGINQKAAYTIGDLLSREEEKIDMAYLEGMHGIFEWLTRTQSDVAIRVSVVRFDDNDTESTGDDFHDLVWSRAVGGDKADLEQADVAGQLTPYVPIMANNSTAIIVETWATFEPVLEIGLQDTELTNIVVTSPRFSGQLKLEGVDEGDGTEHDDGTDTEAPDLSGGGTLASTN